MKYFLFALMIIMTPLSSQALIEARVGYGINTFDKDYQGIELDNANSLNLDVIFEPPMITDLGLGIRYEKMSFDLKDSPVAEANMTRIAALVNYRIIDFLAYFGVIGTVGISNTFEIEQSGNTDSDFDEKLNFTIGLEGGVNLGIFSVGGEIGKFYGKIGNPGSEDIDLNSTYMKLLVGIDF